MTSPLVDKEYFNEIDKARRNLRALAISSFAGPLALSLSKSHLHSCSCTITLIVLSSLRVAVEHRLPVPMTSPLVDKEYFNEIDKARRNLRALVYSRSCAPIMLRLSWHDAGTYDAKTKTGGPNGSIRNEEEYSHGSNNGLKKAIDFCEEVKSKHPRITYADLYQLAGVVAVEVTGGPAIDISPGRKDSKISPEEGQLPDAKRVYKSQRYLLSNFVSMSGCGTWLPIELFKATEATEASNFYFEYYSFLVATSLLYSKLRFGIVSWFARWDCSLIPWHCHKLIHVKTQSTSPHLLGKAHPNRSGFDGPWTKEPLQFDNSCFVELLNESEGLLKLPTDAALVEDPEFRKYVDLYIKKLSELGFTPNPTSCKASAKDSTVLAQEAVGVAVAAVVVSLGYLYEAHKRAK
ncbi:hypothetical protein C1H46_032059 [Malus baccata]|uniref:Plant heme peroxidase family profile domain-containing protein n=1 Tax=Malus baccata TaxID=106549 RepID=A0A540L7B5_MALBA|nr:hypothetical protein C1H46_032059 [Malus baccata]